MRKYAGSWGALALLLVVFGGGCSKDDDNTLNIPSILSGGGSPAAVPIGTINTGGNDFRVLAGTAVTNTGLTVVTGDVGVWPGSGVAGFGPGVMTGNGGVPHAGDPAAQAAQADLTVAFNDAAGRAPGASVSGNIGGLTLAPGTYTSTSSLAISSGDLTLDAQGNANGVFLFQIPSALTVTTGRRVILTGGALASNVFWEVGSSATIGTGADFSGTILSETSVSLLTGATLHGRALARNGAVSLDSNPVGP